MVEEYDIDTGAVDLDEIEDSVSTAEMLFRDDPSRSRKIRIHGSENEPLIPAGSRALVRYVSVQDVRPGCFVVVRTDRGPAIRRVIKKRRRRDGNFVLYCKSLRSRRPPRPTQPEDLLGMVNEVEHQGQRLNPAAQTRFQALYNYLTDFGTTDPISKFLDSFRVEP